MITKKEFSEEHDCYIIYIEVAGLTTGFPVPKEIGDDAEKMEQLEKELITSAKNARFKLIVDIIFSLIGKITVCALLAYGISQLF